MPGIVGLISKMPAVVAASQLHRMVESQRREPFYTSGTWSDETLGVYVGWTARPGSFADGMPLTNERGDVSLIFSGEEYPEPGTKQRLSGNGHSLGAAGASYLVHLYEDDPNFVRDLNGMFHGVLVDRKCGAATLFNDRYGMHRLYYHEADDGLYFASEAKAIIAARPELRTSDPKSLGEIVSCGCILQNRSLFKAINILPGASQWTFQNGQLAAKRIYFDPQEWENQDLLSHDSYLQELRSVLRRVLPRYFNSQEQLAIAITGGLDTRVILALHRPDPASVSSYTFGGVYRDSYDVRIGRQVANLLDLPHHLIEVGSDFLGRFGDYAERSILISEGTVDVYRASDLYISAKARQIAPAKVVGTYGSEIVRHAVMFKPTAPVPGLFASDFSANINDAADTFATVRRQHPVTFAAFCQSPWYHQGILAIEQSQLTVRSPFMNNDFVKTVYRAPRANGTNGDVRLQLIKDGNAALARIPSDRGVGGGPGPLSLLRRASREFTFKAEYAYDYGMPPAIVRADHLLSGFRLERMFLGRHKLTHFRIWYRDQLAKYIRSVLLDPRSLSRPYVNRKSVEAVIDGHIRGSRNNTDAIHKLLTLELIHRLILDAS